MDVLFAQCDHLLDGAIHAGILHVNEIAHGPHVRILGNVHRNGIEERLLPRCKSTVGYESLDRLQLQPPLSRLRQFLVLVQLAIQIWDVEQRKGVHLLD